MKDKLPRKQRAYKVSDKYYNRAKSKADKTDKPLATRIEEFVIDYGRKEKDRFGGQFNFG